MAASSLSSNVPFLAIVVLSFFQTCHSFQEKIICISSDDHPGLACEGSPVYTITRLCRDVLDYSDTLIVILNGTHTLNTACEFVDTVNVEIRSITESTYTPVIKCSPGTGLRFLNASMTEISNVAFVDCGLEYELHTKQLDGLQNEILSALLFINGSSLTLTNVTVLNAVSAGIYIYNVVDNVTMDSCKVINASADNPAIMSGTIVAYDNGATKASTRMVISHSTFTDSGYSGVCTDYKKAYSSGFSLFIGNPNFTVCVISTKLINNHGCNGGNMALLLFSLVDAKQFDAMVRITTTTFSQGKSQYGGGLFVSVENSFIDQKYQVYHTTSTALSIVNSIFAGNIAKENGGGVYLQWKRSLDLHAIVDMSITDSVFENNSLITPGSGGLALKYKTYIDTGDEPHKLSKFQVNLNISGCGFHKHFPIASSEKGKLLSESSVILARLAPYLGIHNTNITSNNCTAILAIGTTLVFYGSSRISNNTAFMGAGLRLCSGSLIYLTPHMELVITNNSVQQTGGGILVNSNCLVNIPMCFYQFNRAVTQRNETSLSNPYPLLSTINVTINNNRAPGGGDNIYGGSIDFCYLLYVQRSNKNFLNMLKVTKNSVDSSSSISSNPQHVCFNNGSQNNKLRCGKHMTWSIFPGETLTCSIRVVGQVNGSVSGTVLASIENGTNISDNEKAQIAKKEGANLTYTIYLSQKDASTQEMARLELMADVNSDSSTKEYISQFSAAVVRITLNKCPFGFSLQNSTPAMFSCKCIKISSIIDVANCSIQHRTIAKRLYSWIGVVKRRNHTYLATSKYCPLDYCNPKVSSVHSNDSLDQDKQCRYNRTGVLCGSCKENWSLVLGSSECRDNCSNVYLLLILPFAVAGFLLILIIHFLNLTVTMGTVCGLIFYANIVQDYSIVLLSEYPIPGLTPILQVFLAWLNLDLGIQTCLYEGMGAFGKTMFLYVFPIYIWLISAVIIFLSNRYICVTRLVGKDAVKVLATLFLLSYSKMLRVTLGSLNFKVLKVYNLSNTTSHEIEYRWILDGNIAYFDGSRHIALLVISFAFIVITLPLTASLLCLKHVHSLSNCCRVFSWINKLKPFFDTYTGPYKDNARFWTGFLLLVRLFLLVVHTIDFSHSHIFYHVIIAICLILCVVMALLKGVYKNHYLNGLECFFILNIGMLFLVKVTLSGKFQSVASHTLVGSAMLVFLGIVCYHASCKFSFGSTVLRYWRHRNLNLSEMNCEGMRGYEPIND